MKYYELTLSDDQKQYVNEKELNALIRECLTYDGIIPFTKKEISKEQYDLGSIHTQEATDE